MRKREKRRDAGGKAAVRAGRSDPSAGATRLSWGRGPSVIQQEISPPTGALINEVYRRRKRRKRRRVRVRCSALLLASFLPFSPLLFFLGKGKCKQVLMFIIRAMDHSDTWTHFFCNKNNPTSAKRPHLCNVSSFFLFSKRQHVEGMTSAFQTETRKKLEGGAFVCFKSAEK